MANLPLKRFRVHAILSQNEFVAFFIEAAFGLKDRVFKKFLLDFVGRYDKPHALRGF